MLHMGALWCIVVHKKDELRRTGLTVGGNLINYLGTVTIITAGMDIAKFLKSSTISTKNARFMGLNIGDIYPGTIMERFKYFYHYH